MHRQSGNAAAGHNARWIAGAALVAVGLSAGAVDAAASSGAASQPQVAADTARQWHRVTLHFDGPSVDEQTTPNPFSDYRLDVTFTHVASGESRTIAGHFAADGRAAETSATGGHVWRVYFSPPKTGRWEWRASARVGPDVAMAADASAGTPWRPLDGRTGTLDVAPGDAALPDFRARGHLEYVGERYLRFVGDGTPFLKGGVDSPETLLGYADFDGTYLDRRTTHRPPAPNAPVSLPALQDGLHRYAPHVRDWRDGDPTWQGGKGKGLIGGLNYLASQGVNSTYFVTMNVNGDGRNVWPWIDPGVRDRYDVSKLDQWEIVFGHMTRLGIMLHVVLQETENDHLLDLGDLGRERALYLRELVSRFAHHPAITWNLGEENVQSPTQQEAMAQRLRDLLPSRQHIVVHNDHWHAKNLRETFDPLLGFAPLTGTALQDFYWNDVHTHVRHYVRASAEAGHPWVVSADELGGADFGTRIDAEDPSHDAPRRLGLWATLMAGGAGVEWYFGWQNNSPHSDLSAEDWRTREAMYRQTRLALEFFHTHLPFTRMQPADDRVVGHGVFALALPGEVHAVYLPQGYGTRLDLGPHPGPYEVLWFDPRHGGPLRPGNIPRVRGPGLTWTGWPPERHGDDWLAVIRRIPETAPATTPFPGEHWTSAPPLDLGLVPAGFAHALNAWRMHTGPDGTDGVVVVRRGVVVHQGSEAARARRLDAPALSALVDAAARTAVGLPAANDAWSALDLGRLGHLVLRDGRWAGTQVASAEAMRAARGPSVTAGPADMPEAFHLAGLDRSAARVLVVPAWEMVVVRLAPPDDEEPAGALARFLRRLAPAVTPLVDAIP